MKTILLFLVALLLAIILLPFAFIYGIIVSIYEGKGRWKRYLWDCALTIDQSGNTVAKELFDDILIHKTKHGFGNPDETISSVLGKNQKTNNLTWVGKGLNWVLDKFEKEHSLLSIEEDENGWGI